jgi:eukaryotic-like serine/threonine-protein kinase
VDAFQCRSIPVREPNGAAAPGAPIIRPMPGRVCLEVVSGPIRGRRFDFRAHDTFLFGRAPDCHSELPADDATASRHHFLLEVNPPAARLRDLGSLNGTWVNGTKYGGRRIEESPEEASRRAGLEVDLQDGDHIRVGTTVFSVKVETPPGARGAPAHARVTATPPLPEVPGYDVDRVIGRGGMGTVYRAWRRQDGQEVALKVMRPEVVVDADARAAFLREIDVTARLRHPNIVALLEHGSLGDGFFFAMEYCPGGSLAVALLRRDDPLSPEVAVRLALATLDGLADAHAQGFVHRDIKPENILLVDDSLRTAKLADFGLAKSFEQAGLSGMTATGAVAGTLYFMPREQLTNFRLLRPASDVWSLGATLYHMLTLSYPRDYAPGVETLQVVLDGPRVSLRERDPALPERLAAVVDRAVADDLELRYRDAAELRQALREAF